MWQKATSPLCHPSCRKMDSSNLDPHLIHGSLGSHDSAPNCMFISSAVFADLTHVPNTQTVDTQNTLCVISVAIGHIYVPQTNNVT